MTKRIFKDHALHIEMWEWLAEHPDRNKWEWPRWVYNGGDIEYADCNCFACETAEHSVRNNCIKCPIKWEKTGYCGCCSPISSFYKYDIAPLGSSERSKYALEVANMPLDKGWKDPK